MGQGLIRGAVYKNESEAGLMISELLAAVAEYDGLEYRITEEKTVRIESYFVRKQLEMNRRVEVTHTFLTVYKVFSEDGIKFRGSSDTEIHPGMSRTEIKEVIDESLYAAGFVKNEHYPLVDADGGVDAAGKNVDGDIDLYSALEKLIKAVYDEDRFDKGYLSYSEFFIARKDVRVLNSNGIDRSYTVYSTDMETAVNWKDGGEIEITEQCAMADFDAGLLSWRVAKLFDIAAKKPLAQMTPAVENINVLLTGDCLREFFSYYCSNANAANVYNGISTFKVGDALQGDASGDKLSITLDPFLKGSTKSRPYDSDGFPLKPVELIKDGVLNQYCGDVRYSSYLDITPTGDIGGCVVTGGTKSIDDMKAEPYLELVSFSGFQMEAVTGDFASEIRLGFYFDGTKTVPVTGGSVSGNIRKVHGDMFMSLERAQHDFYEGPLTVCVRGVAIAGMS